MSLYKEMYVELFKYTTKAIELLQKGQQESERLYMAEEECPTIDFEVLKNKEKQ